MQKNAATGSSGAAFFMGGVAIVPISGVRRTVVALCSVFCFAIFGRLMDHWCPSETSDSPFP